MCAVQHFNNHKYRCKYSMLYPQCEVLFTVAQTDAYNQEFTMNHNWFIVGTTKK